MENYEKYSMYNTPTVWINCKVFYCQHSTENIVCVLKFKFDRIRIMTGKILDNLVIAHFLTFNLTQV